MEHHSNIVPWQKIAKQYGLVVHFVSVDPSGRLDMEDLNQKLNSKTKVLSLTMVSNVTGVINPVESAIAAARKFKPFVVIDAAQAVTSLKIDVKNLDC